MARRILVTGANKGIGLAIVRRCLADHEDTHCILACRSTARGNEAVSSLVAENSSWEDRLIVLEMDTSSDSSVQSAAEVLSRQLGTSPAPLYAIVNNAGIAAGSMSEIFQTNVYGPYRVDAAFLPLLDPGRGRIVQMSSGAASMCLSKSSPERIAFFTDPSVTWDSLKGVMSEALALPGGSEDLKTIGIEPAMGSYGLSKALLNSYTMCLAREHPELRVNSCSPGMVATDLVGGMLPFFIPTSIGCFLARHIMGALTPDEGTVSTMYLLFGSLEGNGRYYGSDAKRSPLEKSRKPGSPAYEGP